ncbi:glycoside hydrolase family 2 protein [Thozetella sp. PMI_491]|nr:glycoside hydrolase family 2 protein [Thozetella sp. PMI_491]
MRLPPFALFFLLAKGQHILSLGNLQWTVSNGENATVPGQFPSQAHLDLYAAGIIDDPLYGFNDVNELWVQRSNWTYRSEPIVALSQNNTMRTWLVFEGLDTFVEIQLCNKTVANVANQFRQFHFDVTEILAACKKSPVLNLNFGSASKIVLEIAQNGPGKVYMRKEQNDFGWDWAPQLSPAGPWRPAQFVELSEEAPLYILNTLVDIYREGQRNNISPDQSQPWVFNASIDFLGTLPKGSQMHLNLADAQGNIVYDGALANISRNHETVTGNVGIKSPVELWWPHNLGNPTLYRATLSLLDPQGRMLVEVSKRVGFRTIVLNLSPVTDEEIAGGIAPGSHWNFEINGFPFYAKGSNFIPPDIFWPRVNDTKIRELFDLVVMGNQNMLRVWSSGVYLEDWIYDLADEMGILLWSEFQFSDSEYPVLEDYLANYEAEAYYNVRRVNHHPSLALWAGGNELEAIILYYFFDPDGDVFKGYEKVFLELLIKCVYANSRSISYIPSSTYNGYLDLNFDSVHPQTPRWNNKTSADALHGDTDVYNYDASQAFDLGAYPIGRFADEFGFISMPSIHSWSEVLPPSELSLDSRGVLHHNRHYPFGATGDEYQLSAAGMQSMTDAVKLWYPQPMAQDPIANFTTWSWSTQVFQADYYASALAFYRRGSGMRERQLGCLYWQLEDLWVAPTWSTIEASGRPKISYYAAKDTYKPVIIRPFYDTSTDSLEAWVVSDLAQSVFGNASFAWTDWEGNALPIRPPKPLRPMCGRPGQFRVKFEVGPINATQVLSWPNVTQSLSPSTAADALLRLSVATTDGQTHSSYFHPATLTASHIRDPGLTLEIKGLAQFSVTSTKGISAWVWLDHPSSVRGFFDDNGFWLGRNESRTVNFNVWNDWTEDGSWVHGVTIRSIYNNTVDA